MPDGLRQKIAGLRSRRQIWPSRRTSGRKALRMSAANRFKGRLLMSDAGRRSIDAKNRPPAGPRTGLKAWLTIPPGTDPRPDPGSVVQRVSPSPQWSRPIRRHETGVATCSEATATRQQQTSFRRFSRPAKTANETIQRRKDYRHGMASGVWTEFYSTDSQMFNGGEGEIRTPDSLATMSDFESGAFNRALPPLRV